MALPSATIGKILYQLRKEKGMTGVTLGRRTSISQSKISKIENGIYGHFDIKEIESIMNILEAPHHIRQQMYSLLQQTDPIRFTQRPYNAHPKYTDFDTFETDAELIELFCIHTVPALLQTPNYRTAVLQRLGVSKEDVPIFLKSMLKRQEILWGKCKLKIVMHESTLYSIPENQKNIHTTQMDRLKWFMGLPAIDIAILPTEVGWPLAEAGPFVIYDRKLMFIASARGDINVDDRESIDLHIRIFSELQQLAVHNEGAIRLIDKAITYHS